MELIDNISKTLRDDLATEINKGSKVSIAAACFSIYAFQELKDQLKDIDELRFIFTSPAFITEKAKKEKREFYIPRLNRERSLYGTEFEVTTETMNLHQALQLYKYPDMVCRVNMLSPGTPLGWVVASAILKEEYIARQGGELCQTAVLRNCFLLWSSNTIGNLPR